MKSRSLFLAVGGALAAACVSLTAPAQAQASPLPSSLSTVVATSAPAAATSARARTTYAHDTGRAVNRQRRAHDRKRLHRRACLTQEARARAVAMARSGRLQHAALSSVLTTCGLRRAGENIAVGYVSGQAVVDDGWMLSAPHRHNLLDRRFRQMGIAAAQGATGQWYVSLVFGR